MTQKSYLIRREQPVSVKNIQVFLLENLLKFPLGISTLRNIFKIIVGISYQFSIAFEQHPEPSVVLAQSAHISVTPSVFISSLDASASLLSCSSLVIIDGLFSLSLKYSRTLGAIE